MTQKGEAVFSWASVLLLAALPNHSGSSRAIMYDLCSMYRERGREGVFSTWQDTMSTLGDITRMSGYVQNTRGLP